MKRLWIILPIIVLAVQVKAQTMIYHSIKDYVAGKSDTIHAPVMVTIDKRTINQQLIKSGGDYNITSNRSFLRKNLRSRYFAVRKDDELFVNCKKLRINKFRFGKCYAPALGINDKIYFKAVPIGPAALAVVDRKIGMGAVGEAVASSAAITKRVYYELNCNTGIVEFVGKDKMENILSGYPQLLEEYKSENNEEAHITEKYLKRLKLKNK